MRSIAIVVTACAAICVAPIALAQSTAFDPRAYQDRVVGEPTQILVLATPHLSGTPDGWDAANLDPLLDRLAAFRPDAIAIEALSGESIDALWRYREIYPEVSSTYGGRAMTLAAMTRAALDMEMPDAEAEMRRTLAAWPAAPTPAQRRRLTMLFLASGDPHSALVQWWRLAPEQRIAEDGLTRGIIEQLDAFAQRRNENHQIASRLAVRLGLERVYATDDHGSDDVMIPRVEDYQAFLEQPWFEELIADPRFAPMREASSRLATPDQALATYRLLNGAAAMQLDADVQWLSMISRPSPNMVGRTRVAEWETRNLRQVANIREVAAQYTGRRVLVIVGSAHKAWFEAYLSMMTDIEIVDAEHVLR